MELCNAGSLYEVIDSPINAYGLDEEQFKLVLVHVCKFNNNNNNNITRQLL